MNKIIITSPSLDPKKNVSGVSSVTSFIIGNNTENEYMHFELGKYDGQKRGFYWFVRNIQAWFLWFVLIVRERHALIHFNVALTFRSVLRDFPLIMSARLLGRNLVIHLHGGDYLEEKDAPGWIKFMIKHSLSGNEPKIVLSAVEKELLVKRFEIKNIYILPNSIDITEAKKSRGKKHMKLPLNLLFIGRIDRNKGLDYIYDALALLKSRNNICFKFYMAGNGPEREEFVTKFTELLGDAFEYRGIIAGKEKIAMFEACNIFLLPSLFEGLPISLLENMAFGNVPIVTNVGSVGTVVTNSKNGIIVKKKSAEEIADSIELLASDMNMLKELSENAQNHIFEHFNPDNYIRNLNEIYLQVSPAEKRQNKIQAVQETSAMVNSPVSVKTKVHSRIVQ